MMKFYSVLLSVLVLAIAGLVYWDYSNSTMKGSSGGGTWEAIFKEQGPGSLEGGWMLSVKQKSKEELTVKELLFLEDDNVVVTHTEFADEVDNVDGTVRTLHPFSHPNVFFGDPPKKNASYRVRILWEDYDGEMHTEDILLKMAAERGLFRFLP